MMQMGTRLTGLAAFTLLPALGFAQPARAAFLRVDPGGGGDHLTVAAANAVAAAGDTIAVIAGLHTVSNLQLREGVQLLGGWDAAFIIRTPGAAHLRPAAGGRILILTQGQSVVTRIDGFEFSGATQSAIHLNSSDATISNNEFHDNSALDGGAVHCEYGASPVIEDNHIHHNSASYGGGVRGHWGSDTSPVIRRNLIEHNHASTSGGGVGVNNGSPLLLGNIIRFNTCGTTGGGVHVWHAGGGTAHLRGNVIVYNQANEGGGIGITGGHPLIENNTVWGNSGVAGGALFQEDSTAPEPGTTYVTRNILGGSVAGHGVYCRDPAMALDCNCVFANAGGGYFGCAPGTGDIEEDPLFCDLFEFGLQGGSPCSPVNSGSCGLIGAVGVTCGPVSLEPITWGRLKGAFRATTGE